MNQFENYTQQAQQTMIYAREVALQFQHRMISPEHLLLGMIKTHDSLIETLFSLLQVDVMRLCQAIGFVVGHGNTRSGIHEPVMNALTQAILVCAETEAASAGESCIGIEHLFLALLSDDESTATSVLESFDVTLFAVRRQLQFLTRYGQEKALSMIHYQERYLQTPLLNEVSRDLTAEALIGALDPLIGREIELERIMQILARRTRNNPILIGPAGVGKTALVEGLAQRIVQKQVPETLLKMRIVSLDLCLITGNGRFRGDLEKRLKEIIEEVELAGNLIVMIDELQILLGANTTEGSVDLATMFKPLLARGEFRCMGTATLDEYRKTIENDGALERRFQPVMIPETTPEETLEILRGLRSHYESYHQVTLTDKALEAAIDLSNRYISQRSQPDKALDLLDEAAARTCVHLTVAPQPIRYLRESLKRTRSHKDGAILRHDYPLALRRRNQEIRLGQQLCALEHQWSILRTHERPIVTIGQIEEIVTLWTSIPLGQISNTQAQHLLALESKLHQRVAGQHEAIELVARSARRAYTDIRDPERPIGSFLFVGPTGVGKSELARALASSLFADEHSLLTLDMSEFMERHTVSRLIGSPAGYVGYDEGGQLTEFVRRHPYCILLFDEVEKAHPDIFDLLLQVLEDGCLTDAQGHTVNFKNTIIILTSNLGTEYAQTSQLAFVGSEGTSLVSFNHLRARTLSKVKDFFRPELLNRLDEIVFFHPLEPEHLYSIIDLLIADTARRLKQQTIEVQVTEAARELLVTQGYEPAYGARSLRRTAQRLLDDLLAEAILHGSLGPHELVIVDAEGDQLIICSRIPLKQI